MNYLTPFLNGGFYYVGVFLIVLTVLVFVHEFGHYWIARRNGVRIEVFSIGFGPELFGWWDRAGTRWKFSAIPLGGYVKMFGDADATSGLPMARLPQLSPAEWAVSFHGKRLGRPVKWQVTASGTGITDRLGDGRGIGLLGVGRSGVEYVRRNPASAVIQAVGETWNLSTATLEAMWQIIIGTRASDELGGPLRIAQMSGEVAQGGIVPLLWFMAVLSINLGLINLFPVPVLDGGHLLSYAAEAIRGKPLGQRAQEYGFRIGLALVLTLMVFATWNDLVHFWRS